MFIFGNNIDVGTKCKKKWNCIHLGTKRVIKKQSGLIALIIYVWYSCAVTFSIFTNDCGDIGEVIDNPVKQLDV